MHREIKLDARRVEYTLRLSKRATRVRLSVYCDGRLVVTAPRFVKDKAIENFIVEKSRWIVNKIDYFKSFKRNFLYSSYADEAVLRKRAKDIVLKKIEFYNQFYGFKYNKISVKNQKSRWGSCSKRGNLNFNYKIAMLPEKLADYIVVHELCHLQEFNHKESFWRLVAKTFPDFENLKAELHTYALAL